MTKHLPNCECGRAFKAGYEHGRREKKDDSITLIANMFLLKMITKKQAELIKKELMKE